MNECVVEIEQCTNEEYLAQFYGQDEASDATELSADARERINAEFLALERVKGVAIVNAKRDRCLYSGWLGASFRWQNGQFGTFVRVGPKKLLQIEAALASCEGQDGA